MSYISVDVYVIFGFKANDMASILNTKAKDMLFWTLYKVLYHYIVVECI